MRHQIKTSVIGSYPITVNPSELMADYFAGNKTVWEQYIGHAVQDMTQAGINYVSDGQTRDPFIQLFTRHFRGCRIRQRTEIIGPIQFAYPITVPDQVYVKQLLPPNTGLIGVLTGPYTLMKSSVDSFYHDEQQVCFDFAAALRKEAELLKKHVDFISIDEPFFSNELPPYARELIGIITSGLLCPTRLHVCGDVSHIVPELIEMPVDILSHEFKASPFLFDVFQDYSSKKKMCIGAVRSDDTTVESVDDIVRHIEKAQDVFGENIVQLAPDCGQRMLPREVAFRKLHHLSIAGGIMNGR